MFMERFVIIINKIKRTLKRAKSIHKESNLSYFKIINDFFYLKKILNISFYEYFIFKFEKQTDLFKKTYLSANNKEKFLKVLNPRKYYILARNKYLSHILFERLNIPKAELYCYYNPYSQYKSDINGYDANSISNILKNKKVEQCVVKTTESSHGDGVMLIKSIDYGEKCIVKLNNGISKNLEEILKEEPLIFESYIEQTKQFNEFNPSSVNTIRMMTILKPTGDVEIISAILRIGRAGSFVDNAAFGGNVDAGIDIEKGQIINPVIFETWRKIIPITQHPDTNSVLKDVLIDNWDEIKATVISCQKQIPFLKAIGWDVAVTNNGPIIIEMNDFWDQNLQLFNTNGWKKEIEENYYLWKEINKN